MSSNESEPAPREYQQHDVPVPIIEKWQKTIDLMASIFDVPAGLIMRVLPTQIEVLLASKSEGNPYKAEEKADLNTGLYCETVMAQKKELYVPNALDDPEWEKNPDVPLNMISYLGVPLICSDGSVFGTICVLDDHTREYLPVYHEMLAEFRGIIEQDLRMLEQEKQLRQTNKRLHHELAVARELADAADQEHRLWLQGTSITVRSLRESIDTYAASNDNLFLSGPNGAGQEATARAIHRSSTRAERPFIYASCPHVLTADETAFGFQMHNSDQQTSGKLSLADGGTLYLEGVEALNRPSQGKLLKILQEAVSQRALGKQPTPDVRFISSGDLTEAVKNGDFDSKLAQLLSTRRLTIPSLAERRDDIVLLANKIIADRSSSLGKALEGLNVQSEDILADYSWPGNLGELRSVVERAVVLTSGTKVDIPLDLLREGRRVGGYTLECQLGSGAMGEVWQGRHALLNRPSAIKLIRQDALQADPTVRQNLEQRFKREAEATSQLRSPHTVELYDFGVTEDADFFYVMEFLNGFDLETLVKQHGPVSPARATFFLRQACMSLGEAHSIGIVHRDIKPANLFACRLGPHFDWLKLLDFGIVRTIEDADQTATSSGELKGTPACMSPEVAQGQEATFASDIYGLGCVAYWLLTGQHVFMAPSIMALLMQHITKPPTPVSEHNPKIPAELDELILQCLAKAPEDRPTSAFNLAEQLTAIPLDDSWDNDLASAWWKENSTDQRNDSLSVSMSETIVQDMGASE
ncbi:MAG: hypothetical protein COA78_10355 [Blastopirellula sp.]|nr:MAG: hypothetical protein COA78_10355 [Blastopirellula sp.]